MRDKKEMKRINEGTHQLLYKYKDERKMIENEARSMKEKELIYIAWHIRMGQKWKIKKDERCAN